ncbi:uncharacterized protein K452DRAFT_292166 [Aplosporella prunicola CBS 121167]|uniref:HD/PDEase domain-containing protein n=1 Tax=Aplosporella prunicola CBS 121167 TaxID=1176127 RepID=A0A6A6AYP2_9PEZI|nr:uncharacterized protein K452DRAFT_292166 [Aplosporella prunicola CBS 121167]KAF2136736.1 hypothetical protein K452DRAFT_292166 [Aplosporella prunicola CBS 121167]
MAATAPSPSTLIHKAQAYVQSYMAQFDASHDHAHILRVQRLAHRILASEQQRHPTTTYDTTLITLGALLHDVGDRKYAPPDADPTTMVSSFLLSAGASPVLASRVQQLVSHVSFSHEKRNPDAVCALLATMPELGIVQDADRLDALGAVGIGRCFAFAGAKGRPGEEDGLGAAVRHFEEKLERLEGLMKTESGRELARVRAERLKVFRGWWEEETGEGLARFAG